MDDKSTGPASGQTAGDGGEVRTPFEQAVGVARDQAGMAADAFRRGEFLQETAVDPDANSDDRLIALLAYASQVFVPLIMPIIVLLSVSSKKRDFQRYHAVQAMALSLAFMVLGVVATVGLVVIQIVPVIGILVTVMVICLTPIVFLMYIIAMLYYGYQSYQGRRFAIPGLTAFLRDQGWLGAM